MYFNSIDFAIFLPIVFILYWFVFRKLRFQNVLLILSSYLFYGWWDWRFLFLLFFSTLLDYCSGIKIYNAHSKKFKKVWLWTSVSINLGFLAFFKYYNFFIDSLIDTGINIQPSSLQLILPVGISFYTFHGLSYVIDIYYNRIKPEYNFVTYALFVSFFPLLVAGPIERATHLLPQLKHERQFNYLQSVDGLRQILWGLFKKIVIADNCATYANLIFNNSEQYSGSTLLLGAIFFAFQIYGDFSGYSDIALGTARLFGVELLQNFAFPYFSRDIGEFWRRWHISLSSWFKDYVYIPLGGSNGGTWLKIRNVFVIFLLSGFWHGANWTFIVWGALNAFYYLPLLLRNKNRVNLNVVAEGKILPSLSELFSMAGTFGLTVLAWIFFRSESVSGAIDYIIRLVSGFTDLNTFRESYDFMLTHARRGVLLILLLFFVIEWLGRSDTYAIKSLGLTWPRRTRWAFYYCIIATVILYSGQKHGFIYFQF
ncbi:MAG TPA: MBOAT family O-acyltransferase [Chryseolinea sp.]|nr:MBOAT family O-acyltransferase [Chryseolinea sp.]